MSIPLSQQVRIGSYILRQSLLRRKAYPLVLMLEPLFQCNLRCKGCGKISYSPEIMNKRLTVDECVGAAEECGAPVVSIPGGEPLLHPDIHLVVRELIKRKKYIYLCTNAQLIPNRIEDFEPSHFLSFNVHLDGLKERHDAMVCKEGAFDRAVESIGMLIDRGFRVTTNTTFFDGETPENAVKVLDFLSSLGVEGITISPGFSYENASDQDGFLTHERTTSLFKAIFRHPNRKKWKFNHSSLYLDFLAGGQAYGCTPWGNPTRNVFGWQRPCYLLDDEYAASFKELMEETEWDRYGRGNDPRCSDCMVHCGFEPSAVRDSVKNPLKHLLVKLRGPGH